ncbi:MAG TPA: D-alanyl-lipoteichoic acid biosynthesis protein DltD [Chthoniobacter sp.]
MESPDRAAPRLHLRAAAIALALVAILGAVELVRAYRLEHRYIRLVVAESSEVKDLGIVWQRECFAHPDFLPLYGSSELIKKAPNKASEFFESYPTGFAVSPVGRPSCTSLILLERIAASATASPGRKVAICVSPSWFLARAANSVGFAGNFSPMQATELFYGAPLSLGLKHDIAVQLTRYPKLMEKSPVLATAVSSLARDQWLDRAIYFASMPLGWLENAVYRLQDHYEVVWWARGDHKLFHLVRRKTKKLDWQRLLAETVRKTKAPPEEEFDSRFRYFSGDAAFTEALERSAEWEDLALLLRVVRELKLDPLLLSMPMEDAHFEQMGISPEYRVAYSERLHAFASLHDVAVVDFLDHSRDPKFFADHYGHPSAKGWIYFDQALDDFFHGRLSREGESSLPEGKGLSKTQ